MLTRILRHLNPLKNFRRGFATNSSSSHSFVYLKEPVKGHDSGVITEDEFQWNDFRLDNLRTKLFYVLASRIGGVWEATQEQAVEHMEQIGHEFPEFGLEEFIRASGGLGVDHESRGLITAEQARDPLLVVFGGNDNYGRSQERAAAVARGEVDWSRTEVGYHDQPPRSDVPVRPYEDVIFKDKAKGTKVWRTGWMVGPGATKVDISRYEDGEWIEMKGVAVGDLLPVKA